LERQILDYLAMCRVVAYATHDTRHRPAAVGVPDITAVKDGHHYAIECKVGKAQPTAEQQTFIAELRAAGATCIIARELADVERYLP
jgi:predicted RecB family endonuclease